MTPVEIAEAVKLQNESFLKSRINMENWLENVMSQLEEVKGVAPKEITQYYRGTTAKEIFPSLYKDPYIDANYQAELAEFKNWFVKVLAYAKADAEELVKCLQK